LERTVAFERVVIDSILTYSQMFHPREGILLLRGKKERHRLLITDVVIPPLAHHGYAYSGFPLHTLPMDFSIMGTAHSHPSGVAKPSRADLHNFYGMIMVIAVYPYGSEVDLAVFDKSGNEVGYEIVDTSKDTSKDDFWQA